MADETTLGTAMQSAFDGTTVSAEKTAAAFVKVDAAAMGAKNTFAAYEKVIISTKDAIGNVTNAFDNFLKTFETTQKLSMQQINQFNLMSTTILGVRKSFAELDNLKGAGFVDQIKFITETMKNSKSGIQMLSDLIINQFGKAIPDSIKGSFGSLQAFAMNLAKSADNALRTRTEFLSLSAATGNLNNIYKVAGPDLKNMNELILRQKEIIGSTSKATRLSTDQIEKYYSQLGRIPEALESVITGTSKSGTTMNMLTAAIKLSQGSGREFKDIMTDLSTAFKEYGLTGESALKFSARMGDVANNLGLDLASVTSHLTSAASAFSRFVTAGDSAYKMSEDLAKITNEYVQALKLSGVTGTHSLEVVKNMTSGIMNMNLQQKAFLSAQTGGPGGLMGAFQIEKLMREGKMVEVMKKVREQMSGQLGKIVSHEEAEKSQAAAAQYTRQISLLQGGPLGKLAANQEDAERLLESFTKGDAGIEALDQKSFGKTLDKGTELQQSMATDLGIIRAITETQQGFGDVTSLKLMQAFTGGPSASKFSKGAAEAGGKSALHYGEGIHSGVLKDIGSDVLIANVKQFQKEFKALFPNMSKALSSITKQLHSPSDSAAIKEEIAILEEQIKMQQASLKKMPKEKQEKIKKQIAGNEYLLNEAKKIISGTSSPQFPKPGLDSAEDAYAPGSMLGTATTAAFGGGKPGTAVKPKGAGGAGLEHATVPVSGSLDVTVHAICVKCHKEDAQGNAMHPIKH